MSDAAVSRAPNVRAYVCVLVLSAATSLAFTGILVYRSQIEPANRASVFAPVTASGPGETSIAKIAKPTAPVIEARLTPPPVTGAEASKPKIARASVPETGRASWYDLASATASGETMD